MKNSHIWIVVLVLILLGIVVFAGKNKVENIDTENNEDVTADSVSNVNSDEKIPDENGTAVNTSTTSDVVKDIVVTAKNFSFTPSTITVNQGEKVRVTFKNTEGFHDFVVEGYGAATKQLKAPAEEVIEFTADKAGTFEYYCSVGTHRQMGMKGTLVVK